MTIRDDAHAISLGAGLRSLRIERRFTQSELAERANVSLGAVRNLERGRASIATMVRVVHALGQDQWLESLTPTSAPFNPLDLIGKRQSSSNRPVQRVRQRKNSS
jgi:transcriptional regulator with XRE-family HTH domain